MRDVHISYPENPSTVGTAPGSRVRGGPSHIQPAVASKPSTLPPTTPKLPNGSEPQRAGVEDNHLIHNEQANENELLSEGQEKNLRVDSCYAT